MKRKILAVLLAGAMALQGVSPVMAAEAVFGDGTVEAETAEIEFAEAETDIADVEIVEAEDEEAVSAPDETDSEDMGDVFTSESAEDVNIEEEELFASGEEAALPASISLNAIPDSIMVMELPKFMRTIRVIITDEAGAEETLRVWKKQADDTYQAVDGRKITYHAELYGPEGNTPVSGIDRIVGTYRIHIYADLADKRIEAEKTLEAALPDAASVEPGQSVSGTGEGYYKFSPEQDGMSIFTAVDNLSLDLSLYEALTDEETGLTRLTTVISEYGGPVSAKVTGGAAYYLWIAPEEDSAAYNVEYTWEELAVHVHSWDDCDITDYPTCAVPGLLKYTCSCGETRTETIPATGEHSWGAYRTVSEATVLEPAKQSRRCTVCGKTETGSVGRKLAGKMTLTTDKLPLKAGQKVTSFKVTGMAKGDYVVSWKSSDIRVVKVSGRANGTCTITAQKRTGKAKIYITLKSGIKKTVSVQVQKDKVKTTGIKGVASKASLQKGKTLTLKPVITPISSKEKVTYSSSNKKVATVNAKGVIKAVKPGKAVITVKCGSKKATCKVTVTGIKATAIKNVMPSLNLKKGKNKTLKPKLTPAGSTDKITYKSSDSKIVSVTSKGKMTAKKRGTAVITVKAGSVSVKCTVVVK